MSGSLARLAEQWPAGTRVRIGLGAQEGTVVRVERAHRTDWVVVTCTGSPYTERVYPHTLTRLS